MNKKYFAIVLAVVGVVLGIFSSYSTVYARNYLMEGDTGAEVAKMQTMLIATGHSCGSWGADGVWGAATTAALKEFQATAGLQVDGLYGPLSRAALEAEYNRVTTYVGNQRVASNSVKRPDLPNAIMAEYETDCVVASNTSMLRAVYYLKGREWASVSQADVRRCSLSNDLTKWSFTYEKNGDYVSVNSNGYNGISLSEVKTLLDRHPEGLVLYAYSGGCEHAVFLENYENDIIYCVDNASIEGVTPCVKLKLSDSLLGAYFGSQESILANTGRIWFVESFCLSGDSTAISPISTTSDVAVNYRVHVENKGDLAWVCDGEIAGTTGQYLRMEALWINLSTCAKQMGSIEYRSYIQGTGWESTWTPEGGQSGTTGKSKRLEAVQVRLTGQLSDEYDIYYRTHIQNIGWTDWTLNGAKCGSSGLAYRLEAIQIQIVKKGSPAPGSTLHPYYSNGVSYSVHVKGKGWFSAVKNGAVAGSSGSGKYIDAFKVKLTGAFSGNIEYRAFVQGKGWSTWSKNWGMSGTTGKKLRVEAVQIRLSGNISDHYDVYYRVYTQKFGWTGWAKNGEKCGTQGYAYRVESIQIRLVRKGGNAPGSTKNKCYVK